MHEVKIVGGGILLRLSYSRPLLGWLGPRSCPSGHGGGNRIASVGNRILVFQPVSSQEDFSNCYRCYTIIYKTIILPVVFWSLTLREQHRVLRRKFGHKRDEGMMTGG
jgi:hypothetical protein